MNRTQLINNILQQRLPLAKNIERVENILRQKRENLKNLEQLRLGILPKIDNSNLISTLRKVDLKPLQNTIETELNSLSKLKRRFKKHTLNIGVVGRARQGKSRLLQSISGLTAAEIPDGDGEHCTGVRSTIYNLPPEKGEAYGVVFFHTESSFVKEVITPYFKQLRLVNYPQNMNDFANSNLPELPNELKNFAEYKAKYEHLKKYKDNLGKYYKLLAKPEDKPLKITREEIRKYVAQDDENGQRNYFNYLAVKEVKIFCSFPQADLGKIALIDLPGLGDTGIGDQERLVKTLGADVDAIIFVRMPKVGGDYWADVDVKLYDTAKSALTELPINLWSYMILNHTPTRADNYRNCQDLLQSIKAKHIDVRQCSIVNCADIDNEVKVFLNQVLNDLVNSIQDLDKTYASVCGSRLRDLVNNQNQQLNEINYILNEYADVPRQFLSLFKQFIDDLSTNMTSLENELKSQIDSIDEEFQSQVKIALDNCNIDRGIPTEEMITKRFGTPDCKKSFKIVYYKHIVELRAHLSRHFLSLNQGLYQSMNSLKISVSASLSQQLGHLTEERGVDFLRFMADIFQAKNNRLELGFRTFYEFEISYGSLLLSLLRQHLNESLSADINEIEIEDLTPKAVQESLQFLYEKTIEKCQDTLNEWLTKPSEVKYFMFEEFLDRILYAEGMEDEWFAFLNDSEIRPQVWLEFKQLEERKALQQSWKMHVQQCKLSREDVVF